MTYLLAASIAWITWVYVAYPLVLAFLSKFRGVEPAVDDQLAPFVSVLIAARNEEKDIRWKLAETLAWDYPTDRMEVLVASDASEDGTDRIVQSFKDERVRFLRLSRRGGKCRALNRLTEVAQGEIFFFTDANAHIPNDALRLLVRHFADQRVGCVTGETCPVSNPEDATISGGAGIYRRYESLVKRFESRMGSVLTCDGAIFCIRSSLFHPLNPELANDVELPMRVAAAGMWNLYEANAVAVERETSSPLQEFGRRRRMCAQGFLAAFLLLSRTSQFRRFQYISHKLLLWLSILPILGVLVASASLAARSPISAVLIVFQVVFYGLCLAGGVLSFLGRGQPRIVAIPFFMLIGTVAALLGAIDALRGRRFDVWEIPELSRGSTIQPVRGGQ